MGRSARPGGVGEGGSPYDGPLASARDGARMYEMAIAPAGGGDLIGSAPTPGAPTEPEQPICDFLRSVAPDGTLGEPFGNAVPNHRCAAFGAPLPLSLRQQERVCLQRVHASCPRFLRGKAVASEVASTQVPAERRSGPVRLQLLGLLMTVAAMGILIAGPVLGLLPFGGSSSPSPIVVHVSPPSQASTAPTPSTGQPSTGQPSTPSPVASHPVTPGPVTPGPGTPGPGTPSPTPLASATWPPGATASRMNLVTPCPGVANCYVYVVRGAGQNGSPVGDTLDGISRYFGVDIAVIRAMNPSLGGRSNITAGQQLRIPPPTR